MESNALEFIAKVCHNVNKVIVDQYEPDVDMPSWDECEEWQKDAAIQGIKEVIKDRKITPEELHEKWRDKKESDGWTYGKVKDDIDKTHPCMVPYDELPEHQKLKDMTFRAIVLSFIGE